METVKLLKSKLNLFISRHFRYLQRGVFFGLLGVLVGSCSSSTKELGVHTERIPSADTVSQGSAAQSGSGGAPSHKGYKLANWSRLNKKKFSVIVIPKISLNLPQFGREKEKSKEGKETLEPLTAHDPNPWHFGKPREFTLNQIAAIKCQEFINGQFKSYHKDAYFTQAKFDKNKVNPKVSQCFIVEVEDAYLKSKIFPAPMLSGQVIKTYLFLDEDFRLYGQTIIKYPTPVQNSHKQVELNLSMDGNSFPDSGLGLFPIDIVMSELTSGNQSLQPEDLDEEEKNLLKQNFKKIKKDFNFTDCSGALSVGQNGLGQSVVNKWCQDVSWPMYTETPKYIAISEQLGEDKK